MKHPLLTKCSLLIFSLLAQLIMSSTSIGCAWGYEPEEDHYGSLFAPEVINEPINTPLFLSDHETYDYSPWWQQTQDEKVKEGSESQMNIREWQKFLGNRYSEDELYTLIYKSSSEQCIALRDYVSGATKTINDTAFSPLAARLYDDKLGKPFLEYLVTAKECESVAELSSTYDQWADQYELNTELRNKQQRLEKMIGATVPGITIPFLKQRYLYHWIRLKYFIDEYEKGVLIFDQNEKLLNNESKSIYYKTLSYKAGCCYKQKNFGKANYLYSRVFDEYAPLRVSSWQSFHPQEQKDWDSCLMMASTKKEKCVLWQLFGLYADPVIAMRAIYTLDPKAPELNLLLVRSVNAAERKVLYSKSTSFSDEEIQERISEQMDSEEEEENPFPFLGYLKGPFDSELRTFVTQCADKENTAKPDLWNLCAGHLYFLERNYAETKKHFARIDDKVDALILQQKQMIEVLIRLEEKPVIDREFEDQLYKDITFIKSLGKPLRSENAYFEFLHRVSKKYSAQGLEVKAMLAANKSKISESQIDAIMAFILAGNHNSFEQFLIGSYRYRLFDFYNYQGTVMLYNYDFRGAAAKFVLALKHGKREQLEIPGDPFLIHIVDCHDCDHATPPKPKLTKLDFVNKMLFLMQKAEADQAKASSYYFLIANGFYNMTEYGNSRMLTENNIMSILGSYNKEWVWKRNGAGAHGYYDCSNAEGYYMKAKLASQSKEFGAKCTFMASKCELTRFYDSEKYLPDSVDFEAGRHFKALHDSYAGTAYYKDIIRECGYFRTFLTKKY